MTTEQTAVIGSDQFANKVNSLIAQGWRVIPETVTAAGVYIFCVMERPVVKSAN